MLCSRFQFFCVESECRAVVSCWFVDREILVGGGVQIGLEFFA